MRKVTYAESYTPPRYVVADELDIFFWLLFTKSCQWKYEEEWRLFSRDSFGEIEYPPGMLEEITMGCQITDESARKVIDANNRRK